MTAFLPFSRLAHTRLFSGRGGAGEAQGGEALEEAQQGHLDLEARERGADADVGAAAEGHVRAALAGDVEAVGVVEGVRVVVGGAQPLEKLSRQGRSVVWRLDPAGAVIIA